MRASVVTAVILGAVASTSASSLAARQDSYPTCALTCIASPDIGSCSSISDTKCLCTSEAFVASMTKCINTSCTGSDLQTALAFARGLCLKAGVTLAPDATGSASASSAASSATATSPAASGSSAAAGSASASSASASATKAASGAISHETNTLLGLFAAGLAFFAL